MKRKDRTAEKAAADPQAVQRGRLRSAAPFGLVFRVVLVAVSRRVLGCGERSEPHLSMTSTRHGAKYEIFLIYITLHTCFLLQISV